MRTTRRGLLVLVALFTAVALTAVPAAAQQKKPNIVMLMTDDTGWNDFGAYTGGGAALGHPTPNIDRIAKEGALFTSWYNLTMDPYEKYDMTFNGAVSTRLGTNSPGRYAGQDNGWILSLVYPVLIDFNKSIIKYPSIARFPGGASDDLRPNLQNPKNPVPAMDPTKPPRIGGGGG